ncbi:MAG: hypothetical protein JO366_17010 [Methylobacteriaceae bacterium]|nr:hypothetical protein [Methylobacteriaceae bacterium]MBV9218041.1 hypothetical protein [Methylobacteriaceae bacterium]MBV9246500.1 hypothetical protein [Methylobacteriaceae bacterium]MBV9634319.1 hypothetical protein [Methylobacteriaceae bacterium]MBV9704831.1 hypothetical protein [Methylobacteriaceae bacterium]
MRKMLAWTLAAGLAASTIMSVAQAMPAWTPPDDAAAPTVTQVYAGCGPFGHRGPFGFCRPGGQWGGYWAGGISPCPFGFHIGPFGRRCWPI